MSLLSRWVLEDREEEKKKFGNSKGWEGDDQGKTTISH